MKPGGHFSISDIVLKGELPAGLQQDAELYVGCVSGAIQKSEYLQFIQENGFTNITVQKEREISLPDDVLKNYLSADEITDYRQQDKGHPARGIIASPCSLKSPPMSQPQPLPAVAPIAATNPENDESP